MGITVVVIAAAIIIGILYLQQPGILESGLRVHMRIDHVESLARGDEVKFRGVRVGTVQAINFVTSGLDVILQLDPGIDIPADSSFVVQSGGILSGADVVINPGKSKQHLASNSVVDGQREMGLLSALTSDTGIHDQIQTILSQIQQFPEQQIGDSVKATLDSLAKTSESLDAIVQENRKTVAQILDHLNTGVSNGTVGVNDVITKLNSDVSAFRGSLDSVDQTLVETRAALGKLNGVVTNLNDGHGSAGKLLTDDTLYYKLNDTLDAIQALAKDIKDNPKKYVQVRVF